MISNNYFFFTFMYNRDDGGLVLIAPDGSIAWDLNIYSTCKD